MVIQAYIDDSRDDEGGTYVLAGYIAPVENWASFSSEWEGLLPLATQNKKGVHRFKMSAMTGRMKDVPIFHSVIMKHVEMAVACTVNMHMLRAVVDRLVVSANYPNWGEFELAIDPTKSKWRDPFFFAFRALMDGFHSQMAAKSPFIPFTEPVDFIFDREQANELFVRSIWQDYLDHRSDEHRSLYGRTPQFEDDEEFLPLQAADYRAWWVRKWVMEHGAAKVSEGRYPYDVGGRSIPCLFFDATEEQIATIAATAIGEGVAEAMQSGLIIPVKDSPLARFWPRKPL